MKNYTGWQWLLIDAANHYGLDKDLFENRIAWAECNLHQLEACAERADNKPLYAKAVMAIRKAQAGLPTGHMVGVDACCSGIQILSALSGCVAGATATGMIDPDRRADAYAETTGVMQTILGPQFDVHRDDAKKALMTLEIGVTV